MYLIIPIILIAGSAIGIGVIVYQKLPYLKKLTPESHAMGDNVLEDLFPELMAWFNQDTVSDYRQRFLRELEKLVRRTRLVFLKVDHISERLIKRIRRSHISADFGRVEPTPAQSDDSLSPHVTILPKSSAETMREVFKQQEQQLIVEIAKNPKDATLYEQLGDTYLKMDNPGDAKDSYEAALELKPTDDGLARKYSQVLKTMSKAEVEVK